MNVERKLRNKPDSTSKFKEVAKQVYVKKDGKANKISIGLSIGIIILLIILSFFAMQRLSPSAIESDVVNGVSSEEGQKAVRQAFLDGINDYLNGDITEDEMMKTIADLINDYLNSTNGFTAQQIEALSTIIGEYLNSTTIYTDIDKNAQAIDDIYQLIEKKYQDNRNYISTVESQLSSLIESNTITDNERYAELVAMDNRLKSWLDDTTADLTSKIKDTESELTSLINDFKDLFENSIGGTDWSESATYSKGDFVFNEDYMYVSLVDNNNSALSDTSAWKQTDIKTIINELTKDTAEQLDELRVDLAALEVKQSSDLEEVKTNLTNIINNNAELAKEENKELKEALLKKVNDFEDATEEGLSNLSDDIAKAMEDAGIADAALAEQIQALKDATAGDIKDLKNSTDMALAALEDAATWSERVTYDNKAYVTHYNGSVQRLYHSLQNNNVGHEPGTSDGASWWEEVDTISLINELQNQVTDNKNHLMDKNSSGEEFQYGVQGSQRGYYVNGSFKPF